MKEINTRRQRILRACFAGLVVAGIFFCMLLVGIFIRLNTAPFDVTSYLPSTPSSPYLSYEGRHIYLKHLEISYDQGFRVAAEEITFMGEGGGVASKIDTVELSLSMMDLALGNLAVRHLEVSGVELSVERYAEGLSIAGIPLGMIKGGKKKKAAKLSGIIEFLNDESRHFPAYRALKSIVLEDAIINIVDHTRGDIWVLSEASGRLTKLRRVGETLAISGILKREGEKTTAPVEISFEHLAYASTAKLNINFTDADVQMAQKYLPLKVQDMLQGKGRLSFGVTVGENNIFSQPAFQILLYNGAVILPRAFTFPLAFKTFLIEGSFDIEKDLFVLHKAHLKDPKNITLSFSGQVEQLSSGNPELDITLFVKDIQSELMFNYFPDLYLPAAVAWLRKNMHAALINDLSLRYKGKAKALPHCGQACGFDGSLRYKDMTLQFMSKVSAATGLAGNLSWQGNKIKITADRGQVADQKIRDLEVIISGLFEKRESKRRPLDIRGTLTGSVQGVIDRITEEVGHEWFGNVAGEHLSKAEVHTWLGEEISYQDVKFNVESDLTGVSHKVDFAGQELSFEAAFASLKVDDKKLHFSSDGFLDQVPLHVKWDEDMKALAQASRVELMGEIPAGKINTYLHHSGTELVGNAYIEIVAEKSARDMFSYKLKSNLKNTAAINNTFGWLKDAGQAMDVSAQGRIHVKGSPLYVEKLQVSGADVSLDGKFSYVDKVFSMSLPKLKVGRTDVDLALKNGEFTVKGKALHLPQFSLFGKGKNKRTEPEGFTVKLQVDDFSFRNGTLHAFSADINKQNDYFEVMDIQGTTASGAALKIIKKPFAENVDFIDITCGNAGEALKLAGIYENIRGGTLRSEIHFFNKKMDHANGFIKIDDAYVIKAPVLAQLLSLLSLEQLFSTEKGILFRDILVPFRYREPVFYIDKAAFNGPSIGLRYDGALNLQEENMDIKGRLIPAEGVNSIISKIPLVGDVLTGSQEGLLVADFSVRGNYNNPKVGVNPLSVVTPGLIKDFFGALTGSNRKKKNEPPVTEE